MNADNLFHLPPPQKKKKSKNNGGKIIPVTPVYFNHRTFRPCGILNDHSNVNNKKC